MQLFCPFTFIHLDLFGKQHILMQSCNLHCDKMYNDYVDERLLLTVMDVDYALFKLIIRESAVEALRAALVVTTQRETKAAHRSLWYKVKQY